MKEVKIIKFMAEDGTVFDTMTACEEYESHCKEAKSLKRALRRIKEICRNTDCNRCPFHNGYECMFHDFDEISDCMPENWEIKD